MLYLVADKTDGVRLVNEYEFFDSASLVSEDDFCDRIFDLEIGEQIAAALRTL